MDLRELRRHTVTNLVTASATHPVGVPAAADASRAPSLWARAVAWVRDILDPCAVFESSRPGRPGPRRPLLAAYLGWMAALAIAFYMLPDWHIGVWAVIGASSATAVIMGILTNRPRRRLPWLLLLAGIVTFAASDTTYNLITGTLRQHEPSIANAAYMITFPLLAAGLLGLSRSGSAGRDRAAVLDPLILTFGLAVLGWVYLVRPYVADPAPSDLQKIIGVAYPLGDVLLLVVVARLLVSARHTPAVYWLVGGLLGSLVADVLHGLEEFAWGWKAGDPADLGWIALYVCLGMAALHPSMVRLTEPRPAAPIRLAAHRLIPLLLASLIAPMIMLEQSIPGPVMQTRGIAIGSAVLSLLVFTRLALMADAYRQSVVREQALREAGSALLSATSQTEVETRVRAAVSLALPPDTPHRVLFLTEEDVAALPRGLAEQVACRMRDTVDLGPQVAERLSGFGLVLVCTLSRTDQPGGDAGERMLVVAAPERDLVELPGSLDVLVSQTASALQRIAFAAEVRRRGSEEYFRTLVQHAADVILIVNDDATLRYASPSTMALFGRELVVGSTLDPMIESEGGGSVSGTLRQLDHDGARIDRTGWCVLRADGGRAQVEVSYRDLRHDPSVRGIVITLHDVTEQRRLERELTHRAFHDSLTGLTNRMLFLEHLDRSLTEIPPTGEFVGLLFLDVDEFKVINDTLGHNVGDQMLIAMARRLQECVRPQDTTARLGGDEFTVLINGARTVSDVERLASRISAALAGPVQIDGASINGAVSIGVATTDEAITSDELLRQADLALYAAKQAGKRQWRHYQAIEHTPVLKHLELRKELEQAVAEQAFALRYQPVVELASAQAVGFEVLLRRRHPTRGLLAPSDFIEVAEESGIIVPIGAWTLPAAFSDAAHWQRGDSDGWRHYLSVNVSARQFRSPGFVEQLHRDLDATGLPPRALVLEISESLLLADDESVLSDLASLREHGIRIAIDDFGTGHSSLSSLRQVPVDIVKIDRSVIGSITTSDRQRVLVEDIIRFAQTLGLHVVAEGVERPEERDLLLAMGCRYGQGFLFAEPLCYGKAVMYAAYGPETTEVPDEA